MAAQVECALPSMEVVARTLEEYAARCVFRGFSRGPINGGKAAFKIAWHRDCMFDFVFDSARSSLRFSTVLPNVPADSSMYKELKAFIKSRQSGELPDHRRIDRTKVEIRPYNRGGNVSLTFRVKDGDIEYGVRRLIYFVNEIFLVFLQDGLYYDYMVETFDLDPDHP